MHGWAAYAAKHKKRRDDRTPGLSIACDSGRLLWKDWSVKLHPTKVDRSPFQSIGRDRLGLIALLLA